MALLEVEQLQVAYGGIKALKGISFAVEQGELVSLLGANGAGKTTSLKAITALHPKSSGLIRFQNRDTDGIGAWELASRGLVMVPEGRGSFTRMTIVENLQMGAYLRRDPQISDDMDKVFALFPRLKERRKQLAGTMSGGEQQMLAIGRALMTQPELIILDEATEGLAPLIVAEIWRVIGTVREDGIATLIVDRDYRKLLAHADQAIVLQKGKIVLGGEAAALRDNPLLATLLGV